MKRTILLLAMFSLGVGLAPAQAAPQASLPDIEDEVMCPTCGVPLEHAFSPQADRERDFIRTQIEQGRSKQQIKDSLVAEYGEDVLAMPRSDGFDLSAYVVPILVVIAAALALAIGLWRWRKRSSPAAAGASPISPSDASRLDRDLSRYDL